MRLSQLQRMDSEVEITVTLDDAGEFDDITFCVANTSSTAAAKKLVKRFIDRIVADAMQVKTEKLVQKKRERLNRH